MELLISESLDCCALWGACAMHFGVCCFCVFTLMLFLCFILRFVEAGRKKIVEKKQWYGGSGVGLMLTMKTGVSFCDFR